MDPITNIDDPRLTAYALGELEGEELRAVERFLAENPDAQSAVGDIAALGATLGERFASDEAPGLDDAQRATIREQAARLDEAPVTELPRATARPVPFTQRPIVRMAALLLVGVGFSYWVLPRFAAPEAGPRVADNDGLVVSHLGEARGERQARPGEAPISELERLRSLGYYTGGESRRAGRSDTSRGASSRESSASSPIVAPGSGSRTVRLLGGPAPVGVAKYEGREADELAGDDRWMRKAVGGRDGAAAAPQAPTENYHLGGTLDSNTPAGDDAELEMTAEQALRAMGYVSAGTAPADKDDAAESRTAAPDFLAGRSVRNPGAAGEGYAAIHDNPFVSVLPGQPLTALSTFAVDVDRASYANVRRFLNRNQLPPADAVRLEELVNAFSYADAPPSAGAEHPFAVHVSSASAPWAPQHRLVRVALKGEVIEAAERLPVSLTFLCDVSGSMQSDDKLPLLKASLKMLLNELRPDDHVSLVTYASGSKVVLPPTSVAERATIVAALDGLVAGGSTAGAAGLQLAYETAESIDFGDGAVRRILLCTDGDFNVGISSQQGLHDFIAEKAKSGVFLTVLGFGTGNYQDVTAETLADRGNGQYAYIDGLDEAHRVLVRQLTGTLVTIAQDVKLQLEFNPAHVAAWRQLGYENRQMAAQDFRNDKKDAGEIGAGHSVVAYYELIPHGVTSLGGTADLKYQAAPAPAPVADDASPEWLTVNLRYQQPGAQPEDPATEFDTPFVDGETRFEQASTDFRFGASLAAFGMALRRSPHRGAFTLADVAAVARGARGGDPDGDRAEFVNLALRAAGLIPGEQERRWSPEAADAVPMTPGQRRALCELGYLDGSECEDAGLGPEALRRLCEVGHDWACADQK